MFRYTIQDPLGIHARPAGNLVKRITDFASDVKFEKDGKIADGKKLFSLLCLGVRQGDQITVSCDGRDEKEASQAIYQFLKQNL